MPIIEMASNPAYIRETLYLYEPSERKLLTDRSDRDAVVSRILDKPDYVK